MVLFCAAVASTVLLVRARHDSDIADLVSKMPADGAVFAHINVKALREADLMPLIANQHSEVEPEYLQFVKDSGFDYTVDLDSVVGAFCEGDTFLFLQGRFNWGQLRRYAEQNGGACVNSLCRVRTREAPEHWVSFFPVTPSLMALASSPDAWAVVTLHDRKDHAWLGDLPEAPFWLTTRGSVLTHAEWLPTGTRSFVSPMADAERISFSLAPGPDAFQARLEVACDSLGAASSLAQELGRVTRLLQSLIRRENKQPGKHDLSGILTQGSFEQQGTLVRGYWPVPREFLINAAGRD